MTVRVLFLNHAAAMGGAEFGMLDVATSLRAGSLAVLLEDGPYRAKLESRGVRVTVVDAGALHRVRRESKLPSGAALASMWRTARQVAAMASEFDVIYANSQKALMVGSIASRLSGTPLLWHLHDIIGPPAFSRLNILADTLLANHVANRVIAVSQATADAFVQHGGDRSRVHVVYNGIEPAPFDSVATSGDALRASLGLTNVPVIGCFSRLARWKGQHVLIEAAAALPNVHVLLVGGPLFDEHDYEARLRQLVADRGMQNRVHFLGQRTDVPSLMRCVDLAVHPSTEPEPFARTLIESMLSGHAPIASRCGGVPELIESGRNGYLFPPGDVDALRGILSHLLANPAELEAVAAVATDHARRNFGHESFVAGMTSHLEAAAASARGHDPRVTAEAAAA